MKNYLLISLMFVISLIISCGPSDSELEAQKKRTQDSIDQVVEQAKQAAVEEAQYLAEQQRLQAEQEKWEKENQNYSLDELVGTWNVRMTCTSSTCSNTSKGDIRSENWNINYEDGKIAVKVLGNSNTSTYYTGSFDGKNLILQSKLVKDGLFNDKVIAVTEVTLRMNSSNEMTGKREVMNEGPCKILYNLKLIK